MLLKKRVKDKNDEYIGDYDNNKRNGYGEYRFNNEGGEVYRG